MKITRIKIKWIFYEPTLCDSTQIFPFVAISDFSIWFRRGSQQRQPDATRTAQESSSVVNFPCRKTVSLIIFDWLGWERQSKFTKLSWPQLIQSNIETKREFLIENGTPLIWRRDKHGSYLKLISCDESTDARLKYRWLISDLFRNVILRETPTQFFNSPQMRSTACTRLQSATHFARSIPEWRRNNVS